MRLLVAGGITKSLLRFRGPLLQSLLDAGHEVHACAGEPDPPTADALSRMGVSFHSLPLQRSSTNPAADLSYARSLQSLVETLNPELVLSYTLKPAIFGSLAARARRVRAASMITGAGQALASSGLRDRVVSGAVRQLLRHALRANEVVFFQNPDDLEEFVAQKLVTRAQCVLLAGSGVELDRFSQSPPVTEPLTFLMIARLLRAKGVLDFAEAARRLRARVPCRFRLIGPFEPGPRGVTRNELARCVDECGIEYGGELDDVRPALADSSVFVLPSYYREGQPRSILEALAAGRAVVTTDLPGCRETVSDGVNGFLVPARDPERLATALERFATDASLLTRMGRESRRLAEERYDVRKVNARILAALGLSTHSQVLS